MSMVPALKSAVEKQIKDNNIKRDWLIALRKKLEEEYNKEKDRCKKMEKEREKTIAMMKNQKYMSMLTARNILKQDYELWDTLPWHGSNNRFLPRDNSEWSKLCIKAESICMKECHKLQYFSYKYYITVSKKF